MTNYIISTMPQRSPSFASQQTLGTQVTSVPRTITGPRAPRVPALGGPWRLMGIGGMATQRGAGFAYEGQMSLRVAPWLELVAEGGQFSDVMPPTMRAEATAAAEALTQIGGQTVTVDARAPAMFGMAGGRFVASGPRFMRPYLTTTVGLAAVTPRTRFVRQGQELTAIAGASFQNKSSDVLFGITGGVFIPVGKVFSLDLGYRVVRGFDHGAAAFEQHQAVLGVGTRF